MDWLEWGDEAFRRARSGQKPILLSISSPWPQSCRLMDRETWSDAEVSRMAAADYVAVRVDAGRRPDIFDRYSAGALPTTVFLTPDGRLLWGGTFLPPHEMTLALSRLRAGFLANRERLDEAIRDRDALVDKVRAGQHPGRLDLSEDLRSRTIEGVLATADTLFGGFGQAPKFPLAPSLVLLARAFAEKADSRIRTVLEKSLDAIADKGLRDPVEGGFFSWSRNEHWTAPETEKLLADQAAIILALAEGSVVLKRSDWLDRAREAADWAERTLRDPETGLFTAGRAADPDYYILDAGKRRTTAPPETPRHIYVDGNAAMVSALLRLSAATGDGGARQGALVTLSRLATGAGEGLVHSLDAGPRASGLLRDPAALAGALLDGHDASDDPRFREAAGRTLDKVMKSFGDVGEGGLLDRVPGHEELGELALPRRPVAWNASVARSLARLGRRDEARRILSSLPHPGVDYGHATVELAEAVHALRTTEA